MVRPSTLPRISQQAISMHESALETTPVMLRWFIFHHTFSWIASVSRGSMSLITGRNSLLIAVVTESGR
ncbi:hypothetical protein D3C83_69970 [compost metagenome]